MKETFKTIATFQYSSEAQIIKGRLEAEGVPVFMTDNHTIDTDPLVSNAIGGVKLKVYSEDEAQAKRILDAINKFSLTDEGLPIYCPNCNSTKIDLMTSIKDFRSFLSFLISFFFAVLPFRQKYEYQCAECKGKF